MNIYNLNDDVTRDEFMFFFYELNNDDIITRDSTCLHSLWDDRLNNNTTGKNVANVLTDSNSILIQNFHKWDPFL